MTEHKARTQAFRKSIRKQLNEYVESEIGEVDFDPIGWKPDIQKMVEDLFEDEDWLQAIEDNAKVSANLYTSSERDKVLRALSEQKDRERYEKAHMPDVV